MNSEKHNFARGTDSLPPFKTSPESDFWSLDVRFGNATLLPQTRLYL